MDLSSAGRARLPIGRFGIGLSGRLGRTRVMLLAGLLAAAVLAGGWLWLRDSPLVTVRHVRISGVRGAQAGGIEAALRGAARGMSTLDVRMGALRAAVASFPVVRDLRVSTNLPHGLRIQVIEQPPVAALVVRGIRTAVAADGAVLGPSLLSSSLPVLHAAGSEPLLKGNVKGEAVLAELAVLGAAPRVLAGWVARAFTGREGLTVEIRNGLNIYFGDGTRPHAKWMSAARVLADPSSAGASYVDVRLPTRPAAGTGTAAGIEATASPSSSVQVSASDPTAAALASTLAEAVKGGASGAPASASAPPATGAEPATSVPAPATAPVSPAESPTEENSPSSSG